MDSNESTRPEIRLPLAEETLIAWTGQRCRVEFDRVEISGRLESTEQSNRYGTDTPPAVVDRNRPDGNGGFYSEPAGFTLPKRYAWATARATLEQGLLDALAAYLEARKLDTEQETTEAPATFEDVQRILLGAVDLDTVSGRVVANKRGGTLTKQVDAEVTVLNSELVVHVSELWRSTADPAPRQSRRLDVEFKHPLYWSEVAAVTMFENPGDSPDLSIKSPSGGTLGGVSDSDAAYARAEALTRAADLFDALKEYYLANG